MANKKSTDGAARLKKERVKFTAGRVEDYKCEPGKNQSFLWDTEAPGLGLRATANGAKAYIFQAKLNGHSIRIKIGSPRIWPIDVPIDAPMDENGKPVRGARQEARRLKVIIDSGRDPRQVNADELFAEQAVREAKAAELAELELNKIRESVTVADAWKIYIEERSTSIVDGKPEWGDRHKEHHAYAVQVGGVKRTRGRRPNEPEMTRPGMLVQLMSMRLIDLDAKAVEAWIKKESAQAPTSAAKTFRMLRAFLTWCAKKEAYRSVVHSDACHSDDVKKHVRKDKTKEKDSLRKAQIKPWFDTVQRIGNPIIATYLQCLLLTGARRNELAALRWQDVDFRWKSLTIRDKVEGERTIPLTPYVEHLISILPRRNAFVFSSPSAKSKRLEEPRNPHNKALAAAALPALSLHGLRRSFGTLSEWVEVPVGIVAQIMGHKPSAIAEKHYIQRELDLLHLWHVKIESWILGQAGIEFVPVQAGLRVVV